MLPLIIGTLTFPTNQNSGRTIRIYVSRFTYSFSFIDVSSLNGRQCTLKLVSLTINASSTKLGIAENYQINEYKICIKK